MQEQFNYALMRTAGLFSAAMLGVDDIYQKDTRYLPLALVFLAIGLQALHIIFFFIKYRARTLNDDRAIGSRAAEDESIHPIDGGRKKRLERVIDSYSGYSIFGFAVARLVGTVILLGLSIVTLERTISENPSTSSIWKYPELSLTITYLYASIQATIAIFSTRLRDASTAWNAVILLSTLGVYMYRDIYPLTIFNQLPADIVEGIPLSTPRQYVPVDPKNPMVSPNFEQVAPWISRLTYSYINGVIVLASRVKHLRHDQLPPLADDDHSHYQCTRAFPQLDPSINAHAKHLFFGLLNYFRHDCLIMILSLLFKSLLSFVAPFAIKETLQYLETNGEDAFTRPWLWISFLLLGPLFESVAEHWYRYIETKIRVHLQALITQLVFEHSLRIRMKAVTSTNPAEESSDYESRPDASSDENTAVGSSTETTEPEAANATPVPVMEQKSSDSENLIGRINNLVTSDLDNIVEGLGLFELILLVPLQLILSIFFLNQILGWSAFVGLFTTLGLSPITGYIGKHIQDVQTAKMKLTDARVQNISEAVGVLRMIKLFGWEDKMSKRLGQTREDELGWLWKVKKLNLLNMITSSIIPTLSMALTYATYTVVMKKPLNASIIFSSMAVFSIMREQLSRISWQTALIVEAKVSLDRANKFLYDTELLDNFSSPSKVDNQSHKLGFSNATFAWSIEDDDDVSTSSRKFRLRIDGELLFRRNCINLIIGPTGSGKTSMLMALLGEMHYVDSNRESWFSLPREGGVAFAAQESWVQNATVRDNIVFGSQYDEERYRNVIRQCALERDLELFDTGDQTEVGERGLTLSGGQKARITLARAIYSQAKIILLDDILAALDVHTSSWIIDQCLRGDLVKGRTILLVTHNVALAAPVADFVVSIGPNGNVQTQGTDVAAAIASDVTLALEVKLDQKRTEDEKEEILLPTNTPIDGKLILSEEIVEGHITWRSMKLLLLGFGGKHPILFSLVTLFGVIAAQCTLTLQTWFLGLWGSQYEIHAPCEVALSFYLAIFSAILVCRIGLFSVTNLYFNYRSINASRMVHAKLVDSVFGSTLRWLDETPTARIISRCTQDIRTIDGPIAQSLMWVIDQSIGALTTLVVIAFFTPLFMLPGLAVGALGIWIGNLYLKAQLAVKREMSNARSPLLAHLSAAIHGLVSIRAYGVQESFKKDSHKHIDHYSRTARTSYNLNRWIGLRIDVLGATFTAALASYLVYGQTVGASNSGFSLNMAVGFCTYIFWLIRIFNELEVESNSLERIQGYLDIDHEPKATDSGIPPAYWPASGDLRVENLSARYSELGPRILHSVTFHIASGQRIGIVGRTGSGKSSLTLALLRCILTEGTVYYDGILTNALNLDALRSSITIIPQTPELLSGTLRQNLDPFNQKDDATLNAALRDAGLFSLQEEEQDAPINLDSKISGSGNNLSVGQRQIVALARAMVRETKLLILDEATSAIDYKTDATIQNTLRNKLGRDVTVITVAHRLQTIMDADKIMVLDTGNIVEFDSPKVLLKKEKGALRALVEDSGDKSRLYELAEGRS